MGALGFPALNRGRMRLVQAHIAPAHRVEPVRVMASVGHLGQHPGEGVELLGRYRSQARRFHEARAALRLQQAVPSSLLAVHISSVFQMIDVLHPETTEPARVGHPVLGHDFRQGANKTDRAS